MHGNPGSAAALVHGHETTAGSNTRWLWVAVWLLLATGLMARISPLLDFDHRMLWFVSEDGYLMQTIARNMAIGLGMTTAQGGIPTNGVQPLATFIYAGLHALAQGDKALAIGYVIVFATVVSAAAAWLLLRLGRSVLRDLPRAGHIAALLAALWFASPLIVRHSLNGLETGVYYLAIIGTLGYYFSFDLSSSNALRLRERVVLGLLLGVTFLARNDAVFFIAALLLAHVALGGRLAGGGYRHRIGDALIAGIVSLVVASPWLAYNQVAFGSVVPISGSAQSHFAPLGANLSMIPANLIEASLLYVPVPASLERSWPVIAVSTVLLIALASAAWMLFGRHSLRAGRFCVLALLFSLGLAGYYGVFFGAAHFVTRYLSALSPLLSLLSAATLYVVLAGRTSGRRWLNAAGTVLVAALLLMAAGRAVLQFLGSTSNGHRQVVDWVQKNVDERQWVGAVQTGTLGYFHDRTLNLDGKVNPRALRERIERGQVLTYVLDETPVNYIVDWVGIAGWASMTSEPRFGQAFEVVVNDKQKNLSVLRRITPVAAP